MARVLRSRRGPIGVALLVALVASPSAEAAGLRATWNDHHRMNYGSGVERSPDGSLVVTGSNRDGDVLRRSELENGRLRWRAAKLPVRLEPGDLIDEIGATGESVFVRYLSVADDMKLLRAKVPGEVAGRATVLRGTDVDAFEDFSRIDATHLGTVGSRGGFGGPRQLAAVDTRGLRWLGAKDVPGYTGFYPLALTASGAYVSVSSQLAWRYPALPSPVAYRTGEADLDPSPTPDPATGTGEDVIGSRTLRGPLEKPTTDRQGGPITEGLAETELAIYSPLRPVRVAPVPVPAPFDADCRASSPVVDARSTTIQGQWRGPDASIWALAGCGSNGREDEGPLHSWLVRWQVPSLAAEAVPLPRLRGDRTPRTGRGMLMRDGAMYVPTDAGTIKVTGLAPRERPVAAVRAVTRRPGGRVRAQIACVGAVGGLCSGRVRIADRSGTLATLRYAVESGTDAMQPYVTREVAARRAVRGKPSAKLLR